MQLISPVTFLSVATRKFKIMCVAHIFLLVLVYRPFGLIISSFCLHTEFNYDLIILR